MSPMRQLYEASPARLQRRAQIVEAASALVGSEVGPQFDPVHDPLCPIDVVMVADSPWIAEGIARDFAKDEADYRKIGGGANTPQAAYFFRSAANLAHYLKRQGLYVPRGGEIPPAPGMACFFDWDDRGRFNFKPDRCGVVVDVQQGVITSVVVAQPLAQNEGGGYRVARVDIDAGDRFDRALIGYADLP